MDFEERLDRALFEGFWPFRRKPKIPGPPGDTNWWDKSNLTQIPESGAARLLKAVGYSARSIKHFLDTDNWFTNGVYKKNGKYYATSSLIKRRIPVPTVSYDDDDSADDLPVAENASMNLSHAT